MVKVGIIGLGVGSRHIEAFSAHPDCVITALCDFSQAKILLAQEQYPDVLATSLPGDIFSDPEIDVVSIATYDDVHYEQIIAALERGKHVFVEKPVCLYRKEVQSIRKLLQTYPGLHLSSNLVLRTCPRFIYFRQAVQSGEAGRIFYLEGDYFWGRIEKLTNGWRKEMEFYSIIYGAAVHMIDLIMWITGMKPVEVHTYGNGFAAGHTLRFNDFAVILLRFEDGTLAKVCANGGCVHPHFHRLTVFGTEKTLLHEFAGAQKIESRDENKVPVPVVQDYPAKHLRGEVIHTFVSAIVDNRSKALVSADDVFDAMSVCFAAEESMRSGRPMAVEYI